MGKGIRPLEEEKTGLLSKIVAIAEKIAEWQRMAKYAGIAIRNTLLFFASVAATAFLVWYFYCR